MKVKPMEKTRKRMNWWPASLAVAVLAVIGTAANAQDFRTFAGSNERAGRSTIQTATAVAETVWGNAGRGFLRWWDPIFEDGATIDNADVGASVGLGIWNNPAPVGGTIILAGGYQQNSAAQAPYLHATTSVTGGNDGPNPSAGATAVFNWQFTLTPSSEYTIEVNLPVGPTNVNPLGPTDLRFTPHYQLYSVTDATGTQYFWADLRNDGGGFTELGSGTVFTSTAGGVITVSLYNVCRRNDFGTLIDPTDIPGTDIVYADAVQAVNRTPRGVGSYSASPVVGELLQPRIDGQPTVFNQRVLTARNEDVFVGSLGKETRFGTLTSFTHNGAIVDPAEPLRRNMVWSWPALRPNDLSTAEANRYAVERQNWITGGPNPAYPRNLVFRQADNLSADTNIGALFANALLLNHIGPDYVSTPVVSTAATSFVEWGPTANDGSYFVEVFLPDNDGPNDLGTTVTYQILQGGVVVATRTIDQSTGNNWVRLPNQPDGFAHTSALPLTVRVLNTGTVQDVTDGREVFADAIRFIGDADLGITATPVQTVATVASPGLALRDVVVASRENGTIVAMEAHGEEIAGAQNEVLWTWPSEDPTTDPNSAAGEDYGIAETPTRFNLSSPLVANVGGTDLVFQGAANGRVFALEMAGRGDGTTRRRWTWPDDFDPTNANNPMGATNVGPINGSVALANAGGTPAILVPSSNGRIFALDAAGSAATRTTTVTWQYPLAIDPPLGEIQMTPVVAFGRVYFAAEDAALPGRGIIYCLDEATGAEIWTRSFRQDGVTPFGLFGSASPVAVEAPIVANDTVYFVDAGGFITSVDAATGAVNWEEASVSSGSIAGVRFAYMRTYNPAGTFIVNAVPTVLVSSTAGSLLGYYADGSLNINGNRRNWGYFVESTSDQVASFAVGGWPNAAGLLANRTHLYIGDGDGILYAFSSEDDLNLVAPITPGIAPGGQSANPGDPDQSLLNDMIEQDDVILLSPSDYQDLESKAVSGTLAATDIATYKANSIQRRDFEMGETLYVLVADINDSTVTATFGYFVEYEVSSGTRRTRPARAVVRNISGAAIPEEGGVAYFKVLNRPNGEQALTPGSVQIQVRARQGSVRGSAQDLALSVNTPAGGSYNLANPFGVELPDFGTAGATFNGAGNTTNLTDPLVQGNLPAGYVGGLQTPYNKWTNSFVAPTSAVGVPGSWFSQAVGGSDPVSHNSNGVSQMRVYDRSLLTLTDRTGLPNVRIQANDLAWQPSSNFVPATAADAGVYKPIGYAGFEDFPNSYPNLSLDYPDMRRSGLVVAKSLSGSTENPLFGGVVLTPPTIDSVDLATYATPVGYEAGLTGRTLNSTLFTMRMNVPQYQPATLTTALGGQRPSGYVGENVIYVDSRERNSTTGFDTNDPARRFTLAVNVGVDEQITTSTKTVDLGSIPAGGGHYDHAGLASQPLAGGFAPFNSIFNSGTNPQFQQVTAFNEGNVNLLNVRVSKRLAEQTGLFTQVERPLELYSAGEHELAWMDAASALFSDLDPLLSPTARSGLDPNGAVFLQKPRPGDPAPSRMSTNPRRRQNSNLNTVSGSLLADTVTFPVGDPYVGVAAPIGTPVGSYSREIFVFEDTLAGSTDLGANYPALSYFLDVTGLTPESYTNPAITLKFNIRETRLTTRPTAKTSGIFDNVPLGDAGFEWSNRQPTISRAADQRVYLAFSSNRLDATGPASAPRGRFEGDGLNQSTWRIYFGSMETSPPAGNVSSSPIREMHFFFPGSGSWVNYQGFMPIGNEWNNWFAVNGGENLLAPGNDSSARFGYPTFAESGFVNPLDAPNAPGRAHQADRYMAFIGETTKVDRTGNRVALSQVMLADLRFENSVITRNNTGALNGVFPIVQDPTSKKGRPALIQQGENATVIYPAQSAGRSEIYAATFNGTTWSDIWSLNVGATFEEISGVSANLRSVAGSVSPGGAMLDVHFTGRVRGRQNSEAFMAQIQVNANGMPLPAQSWMIHEDRLDRLDYDPATGVFWTPGTHWAMDPADVDSFELLILNPVTGTLTPLINNNPAIPADMRSRVIDREAREMVFNSPNGGKVYVDARRGSIRLSGVATGRNTQIFARYSPRFIRVSGASTAFRIGTGEIAQANTSAGANYRGASAVYDDRLLGVYIDGTQPWRNLVEDYNFWYSAIGAQIQPSGVTQDRYYLSFNRTSNDGASASRPVMSTMRFGMHLMTPVAINPNTLVPYSLNVTGLASGAVQVDPTSGKIFTPATEEGRTITVTYTGIDINGNLIPNLTVTGRVDLIVETGETLVPIEQVGQEGDFFMALDRFTPNVPSTQERRPPVLWMIWSSTRTGSQDIYFQTLSPKTAPRLQRP